MNVMGTGHIGPHLYLCVIMDVESRYIIAYEFGKSNSVKLQNLVLSKAGFSEKLPPSRYVSAFFGSLMQECIYMYEFDNNEQRKEAAADWIDYYNNKRLHSALDYRIPCEVYNK